MFDGILIIDKPAGITSHDVVARARRILKMKRIGHTGTLDPFATGVMVILLGKATRLAQFLDKDKKEYEALVQFGFETDTGDLTGSKMSETQNPNFISVDEVEKVLADFRGKIEQTPPMFSAKKVEGKKLYELARKGIEIERKPINVTIYNLEILNFEPETTNLKLKVLCSAGTYIRTLAQDIGRKIGIGAHLSALRRTKAGKFDIAKAVTLEKLEEIVAAENFSEFLISMNDAVSHLPECLLSTPEIIKTQTGIRLTREASGIADGEFCRMTDENANLIAVGIYDAAGKSIQPKLVLV